ncbi:MAG: DUF4145 domain-containing protein [Candidatus Binatia bacterium]
MDDTSYTIIGFEIIGLERLGFEPVPEQIEKITRALQKSGFNLIPPPNKSAAAKFFDIRDKSLAKQLAKQVFADWEEELVWLVTEFFQHLFIVTTKHDLLFGLASTHDPEQLGPYGRPPRYILSEVGDYTYRSAIPRILIAGALAQYGYHELSKNLECTSNLPRETALAGDIIFVDPPIKYDLRIQDADTGLEWRPLSLLSSKLLIQKIVDLLQDPSSLNQVELAKAFPFQLFSVAGATEEKQLFSLLNHFSIRARKGTFLEVLNELLGASLHLNWSLAKEHTSKLSREEALRYALIQNARLKQIEEQEQRLLYALGVLQKRYPSRTEIIEWEVNNLYSNLVRFSPVYLSWKTHLQAFIQGAEQVGNGFSSLISQLDWQLLEQSGVADRNEGEQIIELLKVDPPSTLTKVRVIIEKIVTLIFLRAFPNHPPKISLSSKLQKLNESKILPPFINIYLNTLRLTGNVGAHEGAGSKEDVQAVLPIFLRVVEWFLDKELKQA